jgi:hypothetical protein
MIGEAISLKLNGEFSIIKINNFKDFMKELELCSPFSKKGYQISVGVKLLQYVNKKQLVLNRKAINLFKCDLYGDVVILLDPEETVEETKAKLRELFNDLINNTYE